MTGKLVVLIDIYWRKMPGITSFIVDKVAKVSGVRKFDQSKTTSTRSLNERRSPTLHLLVFSTENPTSR